MQFLQENTNDGFLGELNQMVRTFQLSYKTGFDILQLRALISTGCPVLVLYSSLEHLKTCVTFEAVILQKGIKYLVTRQDLIELSHQQKISPVQTLIVYNPSDAGEIDDNVDLIMYFAGLATCDIVVTLGLQQQD